MNQLKKFPRSRRIFLALFAAWFLAVMKVLPASAADTTPPTIGVTSVDIVPYGITSKNGERTDFLFNITASDDVDIANLEYRARVNGGSFSSWTSYPYIVGLPLYFAVHCNFFEAEFRSVDTSDNTSSTVNRKFRLPFRVPAGTPIEPGLPIVDAPKVLVNGTTAIVLMKKFAVPKSLRALPFTRAAVPGAVGRKAKKRAKSTVQYEVTFVEQATQQTRRVVSKRNVYTGKNLTPGIYAVSYKARVVKRKVVLAETGQSPDDMVLIGG